MKEFDPNTCSRREWPRNRLIPKDVKERWAREAIARAEARAAEIADGVHQPTVLYAEIKPTSKYHGQGEEGEKFSVVIQRDPCAYCVLGGPGGQYRLADVHLFALLDDNTFQQIA